jgi:hypothetical protein
MSIAMIRRGGAHGTRINHQKRDNQQELDVQGQSECRRQNVLSDIVPNVYFQDRAIVNKRDEKSLRNDTRLLEVHLVIG